MIDIKAEIRKDMINQRNSILPFDVELKSTVIENKILSSQEFKNAVWLFTYVNMGSEVITKNIINKAFESGKRVAVPVAKKGQDMFFTEINCLNQLKKTKYGVYEPDADIDNYVVPDENTFFIVPGVAFDIKLNRCGYGAGFYDRYFEKYEVRKKIAVTYDFQVLNYVPTDENDKKVDTIITEKRTLGDDLI